MVGTAQGLPLLRHNVADCLDLLMPRPSTVGTDAGV